MNKYKMWQIEDTVGLYAQHELCLSFCLPNRQIKWMATSIYRTVEKKKRFQNIKSNHNA